MVTLKYPTHFPPFCKQVLNTKQTQSMVPGLGAGYNSVQVVKFIPTNIFGAPTGYEADNWNRKMGLTVRSRQTDKQKGVLQGGRV